MEFYVFEDGDECNAALRLINEDERFPVIGVNAGTGTPEPEKQKTIEWADILVRADGKYCFPRLPADIINGLTTEQVNHFNSSFTFTIEEFDSSWLPEVDVGI